MSWIDKMIDAIFPPVEEPLLPQHNPGVPESAGKETPAAAHSCTLNIAMFEPRQIEDTDLIITCITDENNAAFVNFSRMSHSDCQRVSDRIMGAVTALNGQAVMVSDHVLYCSKRPLSQA